jgi:hypothetical protein
MPNTKRYEVWLTDEEGQQLEQLAKKESFRSAGKYLQQLTKNLLKEQSGVDFTPDLIPDSHSGVGSPDLSHSGVGSPDLSHSGVGSPDLSHSGVGSPDLSHSGVKEQLGPDLDKVVDMDRWKRQPDDPDHPRRCYRCGEEILWEGEAGYCPNRCQVG